MVTPTVEFQTVKTVVKSVQDETILGVDVTYGRDLPPPADPEPEPEPEEPDPEAATTNPQDCD
jgi:hypothetical protein